MSDPSPQADSPWPVRLTTAAALLAVGWPVAQAPHRAALGRACSEAPAHLWGLWVATEGLLVHGPLVRDAAVGWPGHFRHHLIDPIHLLVFAPVMALVDGPTGAVLAWNLLHLLWVLIGALGTARLAERQGLSGWSAAVWVACVAGSSALLQHPELGRSEYLPALGLPWVLVGLWDAARTGRIGRGLAAGVLMGAIAASGPTLALFALPMVGGIALAWSWNRPSAARVRAAVLLPGLVGAGVALAAIRAWPPPHVSEALAGTSREAVQSAELLNLVRLGPPARDLEHTLYLGLVALVLAGVALVRRPRQAGPWVLLAGGLGLVAVGPSPSLVGQPLVGPVSLLAVGPLASVSGWPRAAWLLCVPMGACAAWGAASFGVRLRWIGPLLVAALLADHAAFPGPRVSGQGTPTFSPAPPPALARVVAQLPDGPLATVPAVSALATEGCSLDVPWLLRATALDRVVSATHGRSSDGLLTSGWLARGLALQPERLLRAHSRRPISPACVREQVAGIRATGVVAYVVDDSLPRGRRTRTAASQLLGPPPVSEGSLAAWPLDAWLAAVPDGTCAADPVLP